MEKRHGGRSGVAVNVVPLHAMSSACSSSAAAPAAASASAASANSVESTRESNICNALSLRGSCGVFYFAHSDSSLCCCLVD